MSYDVNLNRRYSGVPLGVRVRGTLGGLYNYKYVRKSYKDGLCGRRVAGITTYRVRRGNGYHYSKLNKIYQDRYPYYVPSTINNPNGEPARALLKEAVIQWQGFTEEEKKPWRWLAKKSQGRTGYSIFIGYYIRTNY